MKSSGMIPSSFNITNISWLSFGSRWQYQVKFERQAVANVQPQLVTLCHLHIAQRTSFGKASIFLRSLLASSSAFRLPLYRPLNPTSLICLIIAASCQYKTKFIYDKQFGKEGLRSFLSTYSLR
jgi:hypothetical protein